MILMKFVPMCLHRYATIHPLVCNRNKGHMGLHRSDWTSGKSWMVWNNKKVKQYKS